MEFTHNEKLAVFNTIIQVIKADNVIHMGEMAFIELLKKDIGFDIPDVEAAEDLDAEEALVILNQMTYQKKKALTQIVRGAAISDDYLHENEMNLIMQTLVNIGLGEELE